jgi:hypothetical protein
MTNMKTLGVIAILSAAVAALATPTYAQHLGVARTHHQRAFGRNWYNSYAGPQYMQHFERGRSTTFLHPSDVRPPS